MSAPINENKNLSALERAQAEIESMIQAERAKPSIRIDRITIRYGELRTMGGYNNARYELELSCPLESSEDFAVAYQRLKETARRLVQEEVKRLKEDCPF